MVPTTRKSPTSASDTGHGPAEAALRCASQSHTQRRELPHEKSGQHAHRGGFGKVGRDSRTHHLLCSECSLWSRASEHSLQAGEEVTVPWPQAPTPWDQPSKDSLAWSCLSNPVESFSTRWAGPGNFLAQHPKAPCRRAKGHFPTSH